MSILKRQRELKRAEKAAQKRAKRHGIQIKQSPEPTATAGVAELLGLTPDEEREPSDDPDEGRADHGVDADD